MTTFFERAVRNEYGVNGPQEDLASHERQVDASSPSVEFINSRVNRQEIWVRSPGIVGVMMSSGSFVNVFNWSSPDAVDLICGVTASLCGRRVPLSK